MSTPNAKNHTHKNLMSFFIDPQIYLSTWDQSYSWFFITEILYFFKFTLYFEEGKGEEKKRR